MDKLRTIWGSRLYKRRKECGFTLQQVADMARTSKSYVWEIENKSIHPSVFTAQKLAKALGSTVEELFDPDYKNRPSIDGAASIMLVATNLDPAFRMLSDGEISTGRAREIVTAWARGACYEKIIGMLPEAKPSRKLRTEIK